ASINFSYHCLFLICSNISVFFYFFFSSRRRHTRSKRDWSSDVCSSDLYVFDLMISDHLYSNRLIHRVYLSLPQRWHQLMYRWHLLLFYYLVNNLPISQPIEYQNRTKLFSWLQCYFQYNICKCLTVSLHFILRECEKMSKL